MKSGKQKACGCLQGNRKKGKEHCRYKGYGDITGSVWYKIKKGALKRKLDFSITIEEIWELFIQQDKKCALTGLPIKMGVKVIFSGFIGMLMLLNIVVLKNILLIFAEKL